MKKVRVLKEMPFGINRDVGEVVCLYFHKGITESFKQGYFFGETAIKDMIQDGWLEWVEEEKSLDFKLREHDNEHSQSGHLDCITDYDEYCSERNTIAHTHFLSLFDKAVEDNDLPGVYKRTNLKVIRGVLEESK